MKRVLLAAGLMLASTATAQVQKWEYAAFTFTRYALSNCEQPLRIDHMEFSWEDSKNQYRFSEYDPWKLNNAASIIEFNQKLYGKARDNALITISRAEYQNIIGALGWEMLSYSTDCRNQYLTGKSGPVQSIHTVIAWYKRPVK